MPKHGPDGKFQKGGSGGPGRPKGSRSLSDALRHIMQGEFGKDVLDACIKKRAMPKSLATQLRKMTNMHEAFAVLTIWDAAQGDLARFQEIYDRLDSKKRALEVSGGAPIKLVAAETELSAEDAEALYRAALRGEGPEAPGD